MRLEVHHYFHDDQAIARRLENIEQSLAALHVKGSRMNAAIKEAWDTLLARVTGMETVQAGTVTLLGTLKAALDAAIAGLPADGPGVAELQSLSDRLGTDTAALADAVAKNTPQAAAPAPAVPEVPAATPAAPGVDSGQVPADPGAPSP